MSANGERVHMQYFYNSVIEFIYFIILYIESYGTTCLKKLSRHVKFFKVEVHILIESFEGKTHEDKLCQMLNMVDCFTLCDNQVSISKYHSFKKAIMEDLIISKCIDLILRGINNIDDICNSLNCNNVISIDKKNVLDILEKSSHFSINKRLAVTLHHMHGFVGFDDYLSNSIISYFHDILYPDKKLSYDEVRNHCMFISFCGIHNMIIILSVLNCSKQFDCKSGYVELNKKSKKSPKSKPLPMEKLETQFSSKSLPVGQIVYNTYGKCLYKWHGEIVSLSENSGVIYCVVNFTNGYQGVFNVCFNKTALKIISEIGNLKKYLNIRDNVEFNAVYYEKNFDRCWRATHIKLRNNNKFEYEEDLYKNLCHKSQLLRYHCVNNNCCLNSVNVSCSDSIPANSVQVKSLKYLTHSEEKSLFDDVNVNIYKSYDMNNSIKKFGVINKNKINKSIIPKCKSSIDIYSTNLFVLDYSFMFGFIYLLMADKCVAIAKQGGKCYNILFMKNSVYALNKEILIKGQKVLLLIPYHGTIESFCVSTFVYGLNDQETNQTERNDVLPQEFATKVFMDNILKKIKCNFCYNYNILNGFKITKEKCLLIDLKQRMQLTELYNFILRNYKIPFQNDYLLQLLCGIYKMDFNEQCSLDKKFFYFIVKLSKYLKKHVSHKYRIKCERKQKRIENYKNNSDLKMTNGLQVHCTHVSMECLAVNKDISNSLVTLQDSISSLNSYKSCDSIDSVESFHSCNSDRIISNLTSSDLDSLLNENQHVVIPDIVLPTKIESKLQQVESTQIMLNKNFVLSEECNHHNMKIHSKNVKRGLKYRKRLKYLCLQSIPCLKHAVKVKRIILPNILKPVCKSCFKSSATLAASLSLISNSFFFYTLNINDCDVTLPLLKQVIPPDLQRNLKLNSSSEITVIPNALPNLSHIVAINIFS